MKLLSSQTAKTLTPKINTVNLEKPQIEDVPWKTAPQLTSQQVQWGWGGARAMVIQRASSVWTGNQSFTGFWFKPNSYIIQAWEDGLQTPKVDSMWGYDGTTEQCTYSDGTDIRGTSSASVRLKDGANSTRGAFVSFDSDGITLNFTTSAINAYLIITCFW